MTASLDTLFAAGRVRAVELGFVEIRTLEDVEMGKRISTVRGMAKPLGGAHSTGAHRGDRPDRVEPGLSARCAGVAAPPAATGRWVVRVALPA